MNLIITVYNSIPFCKFGGFFPILAHELGATSFLSPTEALGYLMPCEESPVYSLHFWFSGLVIYKPF